MTATNHRPAAPAVGALTLTAVNGISGERYQVLRDLGRTWTLGTVRTVKARVGRYDVELDADASGVTRAWCACGLTNGRGCHHAHAAYRAAGGTAHTPAAAEALAHVRFKERSLEDG